MRDYFEAEMRLLHEAAQEFAEAHPEQARQLNLKSLKDRDPYVERLLEGTAYLTAQIRQRIDDDYPELCDNLLAQVSPTLTQVFPSASITQFTPRSGQLQQAYVIPKGSRVSSKPVGEEHIACHFQTCYPVTVNPIDFKSCEAVESNSGGTIIRLNFMTHPGVSLDKLDFTAFKLFLHADPSVALNLYFALAAKLKSARVVFSNSDKQQTIQLGGQDAISPCHLDYDETLLKHSGRDFAGFQVLQEYFALQEKYLFVTINQLDKIKFPENSNEFTVELHTQHLFTADTPITKNNFQLHCTPVINLYEMDGEPIQHEHKRREYPVYANSNHREGLLVHSVDNVIAIDTQTGERSEYHSLQNFKQRQDHAPYYQINRHDNGIFFDRHYLSIGGEKTISPKTISSRLSVSNGLYPRRYLKEQSICMGSEAIPAYISISNITRPSVLLRPPKRRNYQWTLLSHLSLSLSSLSNREDLLQILSTYDWTDDSISQQRIEAIQDIQIKTIDKIVKGAMLRGVELRLTINDEAFRNTAEVYLFGTVLHQFFNMYAAINCFVQTHIHCYPSNQEFSWQAKLGQNPLI